MMVLRWRQPPPPIALRWRGADSILAAEAAVAQPAAAAAIIGPPGTAGPPGPPGPIPEIIDGGTFS